MFLVIKKAEESANDDEGNAKDEDAEEDAEDDKLPFQTRVGQLRSSEDIAADKRFMKQFLRSHKPPRRAGPACEAAHAGMPAHDDGDDGGRRGGGPPFA